MFTVEGNKIFALYFFFFWLMTVKEICALQFLFLEISFSLTVRPADLGV